MPFLALPVVLAADVFSEAHRIERAELGDLFWSAAAGCDSRADDALRRQCRLLASERARAWAGGTYVIRADEGAVAVEGGQTVVRGCLACAQPARVAGEERAIVTRGNVGDGLAPELGRVAQGAGPVDIVFRLPPSPEAWSQGTRRGFFVEAVAWRFVAPAAPAAAAPAGPQLPEILTAEQIKAAMAPVAKQVDVCFDSYGVPGTADLGFEVGGDGAVKHAEVRGELADTPTAKCIIDAVTKATFPRFKRPTMWINFPFTLR